jgi:phage-related protein
MTPRRWRDYQTSSGRRPVRDFLQSLSDEDAAEVVAAMAEVRELGLQAARKLRDDIWEVRADGNRVIHRVLFAQEGRRGFILLALVGFTKKTQRTPPDVIVLAERRLADWRSRAE